MGDLASEVELIALKDMAAAAVLDARAVSRHLCWQHRRPDTAA